MRLEGSAHPKPLAAVAKPRSMTRMVLLLLLFLGLTVVMGAPWSLHPASRVIVDNPDTHLFLWTLGWNAHAFATDPLRVFDANIFYPFANTLAYSENLLGTSVFAAPIIWSTGDLVLALNVVSLLSTAVCGLGAFVLARQLGLSAPAAVLAGIVFAFAPTRFFRMSQMFLNSVQWIPFCLASLHAYLEDHRPRDLRRAVGWFSLQAVTSGHAAMLLAVAVAVLLVWSLVRGAPVAAVRRIRDVGLTGVLALLPAVLILLPYRRAHAEVGLDRSLGDWGVTPQSFIASPSLVDTWLLSLVTSSAVTEEASTYLFPGVLVLILSVIALWPRRCRLEAPDEARRRAISWFYALLALLSVSFFVKTFGTWDVIRGWPGFNLVRVPSRFMTLTTLCLAVLAAAGFDRITGRLRARQLTGAAVVTGLLLLGEFSAYPFEGREFTLEIPAVDRWLATQPTPFAVAETPVPDINQAGPFERFQTMAMLHSTAHWQKTLHGFSGIRPALHDRVLRELHRFPDDTSLASLREFGVGYVVVHRYLYRPDEWAEVARRLRETDGLQLVHTADGDEVYSVAPWPESSPP